MSLLRKFRIPFSEDKKFGFLLLGLCTVSLLVIQSFSEPYEGAKFACWTILIGLSLAFFLVSKVKTSVLPFSVIGVMSSIWLFVVVATIYSVDRLNSVIGVNIRMTSSLWFFSLWLLTILLLSTLEKQKISLLIKVWMFLGGVISLWAILQFFGVGFYEGINAEVRALIPSFLGNPNFSAMYVCSSLFVTLWFVISINTSRWFRIFASLILGLNIVALFMFASRGAILATVFGLAIILMVYLINKRWKLSLLIALLTLMVVGLSSSYLYVARDQTVNSAGADDSAQQRWYLWDHSFSYILEHPLGGGGLGNYFIAYRQNQSSYLANITWFDDSHNLFLHLGVTGGIQLSITFSLLLALVFWNIYRVYWQTKDDFLLFLSAALVAWVISASFNPVTLSNWFILALIIVLSFKDKQAYNFTVSRFFKVSGYIFSMILVIAGTGLIVSEVSLWASGKYKETNLVKAVYLARVSVIANPGNITALLALGDYQYLNSEYENSYQTYLRLENLHPKSGVLAQKTANGYISIWEKTNDEQKKQEAYRAITKTLKRVSNDSATRYNTTTLYMLLGDYEKALLEARAAVVLSNGRASSWVLLSNVYEKLNQPEKQKLALEKAQISEFRYKLRN